MQKVLALSRPVGLRAQSTSEAVLCRNLRFGTGKLLNRRPFAGTLWVAQGDKSYRGE